MTIHLVISDVHGDIKTLQLLLDKYQNQFDDIWCLGDIAGHGELLNGAASPIECFKLLYKYELNNRLLCVKGNWEYWVTSLPLAHFMENQTKLYSQIVEARKEISDQLLMDWITKWDLLIYKNEFALTHGWIEKILYQNEREPVEAYLEEEEIGQVTKTFLSDRIKTRHVLVGHTHKPGFFRYNGRSSTVYTSLTLEMIDKEQKYDGRPEFRFVLNPGSLSGARYEKYIGLKTALLINTEAKSFRFISL